MGAGRRGEVRARVSGAVKFQQRSIQQMTNVHDRGVRRVDQGVERHRAFAHDDAFSELGSADQPEMEREREPECADREQPE